MHPDDTATDAVVSGRAWAEFCDALKAAGDLVLSHSAPDDPLERAEGFRYLSRLARGGLEAFVENADPRFPRLRPLPDQVKIGADNPDNHYQSASISGRYDYRLRGRRGTVNYLGFGAYSGNYGQGTQAGEREGYLEDHQLDVAPDGTFEVVLSCRPQPGNWLRMTPDTTQLIVRQSFLDREHEELAELVLERLDADGQAPGPLRPERLANGLAGAALFVHGCARRFVDWADDFATRPNELHTLDPDVYTAALADPNIRFYHGYWTLGPGEALVIEATPPPPREGSPAAAAGTAYWNFQLNNRWMESLDYRYHRVTLNAHAAASEPDGSVRIVVAHEDPGVANWIETAGHRHGTMGLRWVRAARDEQPRTRVAPLDELRRGAGATGR